MSESTTTDDIRRGIERKYNSGWAVMHEVPNTLGGMPPARAQPRRSKRFLDVVCVGLYRSTEYRIVGHEIKRTRADFLAELRTPEKAQAFAGLVHEFWLVTVPGIVKPGEVPDGWGHLVYHPSGMRSRVRALTHDIKIPKQWAAVLVAYAARAVGSFSVEGES